MTERVGLIGWPLGHSLSPFLHNRAFLACGLDWRYELLPVQAEALEGRMREWLA
ncbi:MAG: shikimate dehydrogenase, partial [Anaerolineales bacterium]